MYETKLSAQKDIKNLAELNHTATNHFKTMDNRKY